MKKFLDKYKGPKLYFVEKNKIEVYDGDGSLFRCFRFIARDLGTGTAFTTVKQVIEAGYTIRQV